MIDLHSLDIAFLGNPASRWALASAAALVFFTVLTAIKAIVLRRTRAEAEADPVSWEATVHALTGRIWTLFLLAISLFVGSFALEIPESYGPLIRIVGSVVVLIQAAMVADELVQVYASQYVRRQTARGGNFRNAIALIRFFGRTAVWSLAALVILDNLGIDVTALVAGLGIGGIAIALAAQNVLGDLFASLAIILDKPFVVGDFIIFGDELGTVEQIGIKTTRLTRLSGEQLIVPNSDLLGTRVRNMQRMAERRVVFQLGLVYGTPYEKLKKVPDILKEIIENEPRTRLDRAHFASYGDFSLNFEIVYYVLSREYNEYMDIQQSINFKLFERFEQEGLEFAFPTRTVIVSPEQEQTAAAAGGE